MPTSLRSYAKINLGLRIGAVRPEGFHALATVYQTVDAWDRLTIEARPAARTEITLACADKRVPCDKRNTAWKAAESTLAHLGITAKVHIAIEKSLPVQGGLGAGSANAAAALLGLERELMQHGIRPLTEAERFAIAARVGSDVPLFLSGGTSLGTGHGEQVTPLSDGPEHACILAIPNAAVSTPEAFRAWDSQAAALTHSAEPDTLIQLSRAVSAVWGPGSSGVFSKGEGLAWDPVSALVHTGIENDFEQVVFPRHPLLRDLRAALAGSTPGNSSKEQAIVAMLSGSGAALFGLYLSDSAAQAAAARVEALGARAVRTRTICRERYWREMWL